MALQYRFFTIPITDSMGQETELNTFLKSVRVNNIYRELVCQDGRYYWAMAVEYVLQDGAGTSGAPTTRKKIDYKEVLTPDEFAVFIKLREWRKEQAGREAVQLYILFTNEQLATMVEKRVTSKTALRDIEGVGEARVEKYGEAVLNILKESFETTEQVK
jgi:superfamily II DNA helicase RecQ